MSPRPQQLAPQRLSAASLVFLLVSFSAVVSVESFLVLSRRPGQITDSSSTSWASSFINDDDDDKLRWLQDWALQPHKIARHPRISWSRSASGGRGVVATDNIPADTVILHCPYNVLWSSEECRKQLTAQYNLTAATEIIETSSYQFQVSHFYLWLQLLLQHAHGNKSPWQPWIQALPVQYDTALCLSETEMDLLPPLAWSLANIIRGHFDIFRQAAALLPTDFPMMPDKNVQQWAFNAVFTRCWRHYGIDENQDDERCDMVPTGDLFNHCFDDNVAVEYDDADNCLIRTQRAIRMGEELFLSYGRTTNPYRFLVMFGFVDTTPREIQSQITVTNPSSQHVDMGYDINKMTFAVNGTISEAVWDVTLYSILAQVPDQQEAFYQAHMDNTSTSLALKGLIRSQYHLETCLTVRSHVMRTLEEMRQLRSQTETILGNTIEDNDEASALHETPDTTSLQHVEMIHQNNVFVSQIFDRVRNYIDDEIKAELVKRKAA